MNDCAHQWVLIWPNPSFQPVVAVKILPLYGCVKCGATIQETDVIRSPHEGQGNKK